MKKIGLFFFLIFMGCIRVQAQSGPEHIDEAKSWIVEQLNRYSAPYDNLTDYLCSNTRQELIVTYKVSGKDNLLAFCPWEQIRLVLQAREDAAEGEVNHFVLIHSDTKAILRIDKEGSEEMAELKIPLKLTEERVQELSSALNRINTFYADRS